MNKTVTLISLSIAISILSFMNHPMVISTSVDTKVIVTIIFFVSVLNVVLFILGHISSLIAVFVGRIIQKQRFKKFLAKPHADFDEINMDNGSSFNVESKNVYSFHIDLHEIGDAIYNFGENAEYFTTDENGYVLVSPEAVIAIRECGIDIKMYAAHYHNRTPEWNAFEPIRKKLYDACHYNNTKMEQ